MLVNVQIALFSCISTVLHIFLNVSIVRQFSIDNHKNINLLAHKSKEMENKYYIVLNLIMPVGGFQFFL